MAATDGPVSEILIEGLQVYVGTQLKAPQRQAHCLFLECCNEQSAKLAAPVLGMDGDSSQDPGVCRGQNQSTRAWILAIDPQQHVDRSVIQTIVIQLGRDTLLPDKDLIANGFGCGQIFG